jgi:hypothetical protein
MSFKYHHSNTQHMATEIGSTRCILCDKKKASSKCLGCLQDFCCNHRQELSKGLDEIEIIHDLVRQTFNE